MKRPALLVVLLGAAALAARKKARAGQAEKDLWTEATAAPDLR